MAWGNALWMWELSCKATALTSKLSVGSTWEKLLGGSSQSSKCESFYTRTMLLAEVQWTLVSGAKATGGGGLWSWLKWGGGASTGTSFMPVQWCKQLDWTISGLQFEKERNYKQAKLFWFCDAILLRSDPWILPLNIKACHKDYPVSKVIYVVFSAHNLTCVVFDHWTIYEAYQ